MAFRAASRLRMADDYDRLFLAAQLLHRYWRYGGKTFETAEQVVEYAKNPS